MNQLIELINYIPLVISVTVLIWGINFVKNANKKMNKDIEELLRDTNHGEM